LQKSYCDKNAIGAGGLIQNLLALFDPVAYVAVTEWTRSS